MTLSRLEQLKKNVEADPSNSFARYGLAMELKSHDDPEAAVRNFLLLVERDPDYVPAYLQLGMTLVELGRGEEARRILEQGVEVALRKGEQRAHEEISWLLEDLRSGRED